MTAIEKLRAAFASQIGRNVDPHEELILVGRYTSFAGARTAGDICGLPRAPERESWQDDDGDDEPEFLTLFDMFCVLDEIAELTKRPPVEKSPEAPSTDPQARYLQLMDEWQDSNQGLSFYKERERELRAILFAGAFPDPKEGTMTLKLPDGTKLKGQHRINRKIDEAALPTVLARMRELGVANTDALVKYKPSLVKREWNTLSDDMKREFSPAVIATPGSPSFDIEPTKGSK